MERHLIGASAVLLLSSLTWAGGVIELVPDNPGPYIGGETIWVDVWLHNEDAVGHDLRLVQLDPQRVTQPVYVGGRFTQAGSLEVTGIVKCERNFWSALGGGIDDYHNTPCVFAIEAVDTGLPAGTYIGGDFTEVAGVQARNIAYWDGAEWSNIADFTGAVRAFEVHDDGAGPCLFAAGDFRNVDGVPMMHIAKWDGSQWSALGTGTSTGILALQAFDGDLYAAGWFFWAGGVGANHIARWDGSTWSPVGPGTRSSSWAMTVFDDGTGPALIVGGFFFEVGDLDATCVAKWDGEAWSPLGSGLEFHVRALEVFDAGSGPKLYAGGTVGEPYWPDPHLAEWDGVSWQPIEDGPVGRIYMLAAAQNGDIPVLIVGGDFTFPGDPTERHLARWDGYTWSHLGGAVNDQVFAAGASNDFEGADTPGLSYPILFEFDYSTLTYGGALYLEFPELPRPLTIYLGMGPGSGTVLHLPGNGSLRLGTLRIRLPAEPGAYVLDVMNASDGSPMGGAQILSGFDEIIVWRAYTGELTGGTHSFCVPPVKSPLAEPYPCPPPESGGSCGPGALCEGGLCTCATDDDCINAASCLGGFCYAPKNRYVSIARDPDQAPNTARRITLEGGGAGPWWVGEPEYEPADGIYSAVVSNSPVYAGIGAGDWVDGDWPEVVHLKGCEIAPGSTYYVQAIAPGCSIEEENSYSPTLALPTAPKWGDIVSTCIFNHCLPPEGTFVQPTIDDVLAIVNRFLGIDNAPLPWMDVDPVAGAGYPEGTITIGDQLMILNAFSGQPYPGWGPLGCP